MVEVLIMQDTVLFNDSIQFNISYGRIGASLAEVKEVAALADIHVKVFPFIQRLFSLPFLNLGDVLSRWIQYQSGGTWGEIEWGRKTESGDCQDFPQVCFLDGLELLTTVNLD